METKLKDFKRVCAGSIEIISKVWYFRYIILISENMTTKEVIEIGKKIIILAGTHKQISKKQALEIIKELEIYKVQLETSNSKYAQRVLGFICDISSDISMGRELQINTIKNDNYIENLLASKSERDIYNSLIQADVYQEIIQLLRGTKVTKAQLDKHFLQLEKNFNSHIRKLSVKNISKNLMIFTSFQIEKPQQAFQNLLDVLAYRNIKIYNQKLIKMHKQVTLLKQDIKSQWIVHYKKNTFQYKYMDFNLSNNFISNEVIDTSFSGYKSGGAKNEYRKLLLQL